MTINIIWTYGLIIGAILLPIIVLPNILRTRRSPAATMAWSLGVILLPFVAVPLYFLLAGRTLPQGMRRAKQRLDLPRDATVPDEEANDIDRLLRRLGLPGATNGNSITWQNDGCSAYTALLDVIDNAKRSISVCVYIFEADEIGQQVLDRLEQRAREGLEVCLLVDGVGSIDLADSKLDPLRAAGGRVATFNRLIFGAPRGLANLRNHRKSVIADSRRVWSGGRNISTDYLGVDPDNNNCWTDLTFVIEGPAARIYEQIFASDWAFASGEELKRDRTPIAAIADGDCVAQVVPSGPDVPNDALFSVLLTASYAARKRIWIVTPYFVPDDSLQHAWVLAAKLGIDVRFVVPDKSDSRLVDVARMDYLRELQRAGAKILRYRGATLHMKAFVFDDSVAAVGSANMDIRSLFLNFEAMTFVYSPHAVGAVATMIESLFGRSSEGVRPIGRYRGMLSGAARLLAPLL
jgi:cardiolipin synthase